MPQDKYSYFEMLFRDNYSKLYFYVLNLINDANHAEDIVEDVFAQVWENFDSIVKEDKPLLPLLYALARNESIDYLRHCEVKNKYEDQVLKDDDIFTSISNDDEFEHQERIEAVMQCIQSLPPRTQKVFKACFLDGKKYKEVGDELGISVNTVKTYIIRALSFIRNSVNSQLGNDNKTKKLMRLVTYLVTIHV